MPHLTWLSLRPGQGIDGRVETPFALEGLPNLSYLCLRAARNSFGKNALSSISLRLPALRSLEVDEDGDEVLAPEVCEVEIQCPSLVSLRFHIHAEISMSTAWFAHLRSVDLTLHDVSA